jgi:hypothetical protein
MDDRSRAFLTLQKFFLMEQKNNLILSYLKIDG